MTEYKNYIIGSSEAEHQRNYTGGNDTIANTVLAMMILIVMFIVYKIYTTYSKKSYVDSEIIQVKKIIVLALKKIKQSKTELKTDFDSSAKSLNVDKYTTKFDSLANDYKNKLDEIDTTLTNLKDKETAISNLMLSYKSKLNTVGQDVKKTIISDLNSEYQTKLNEIDTTLTNLKDKEVAISNLMKSYKSKINTVKNSTGSSSNKGNSIGPSSSTVVSDVNVESYKAQYEKLLTNYNSKLSKINIDHINMIKLNETREEEINKIMEKFRTEKLNLETKKQTYDNLYATKLTEAESALKSDSNTVINLKNKYQNLLDEYDTKTQELTNKYNDFNSSNQTQRTNIKAIIREFETQKTYLATKRTSYDTEFAKKITNAQSKVNLDLGEIKSLKSQYQTLINDYDSAVTKAALKANNESNKTNLGVLEKLVVTGNVTIGDKDKDKNKGYDLSLVGGHNKGASIKFLDAWGDDDVFITGHKKVITIHDGGFEVDKDAIINGDLQVNKVIKSHKMELYDKEDDEGYRQAGLLTIKAADPNVPGVIEFTDRDGNPLTYIQGKKSGLYISNNIKSDGYIRIAAYKEVPAKIIFNDNKGNVKSVIKLDDETLDFSKDLKVNGGTHLVGTLKVDGKFILNNTLTGKEITGTKLNSTGDLNVSKKANINGNLEVKGGISAHSHASFHNGLTSKGKLIIKSRHKTPGSLILRGSTSDKSFITFTDSNEKILSKIEATQNGLTIDSNGYFTGSLGANKLITARNGISIGDAGKKSGKNQSLTMYGSHEPSSIEWRSNKQTKDKKEYQRQAYIKGVGHAGGGIAIKEGPLQVDKDLTVDGKSTLTGDISTGGNISGKTISGTSFNSTGAMTVDGKSTFNNTDINGQLVVTGGNKGDKIKNIKKVNGLETTHGIKSYGTLEAEGNVNVGASRAATKDTTFPRGILNINSNNTKFGSIYFKNQSRINNGEITADKDNIIINGKDLKTKNNFYSDKTITAGGLITGNLLKSTIDITAGGLITGKGFKSTADIIADGNISTGKNITGNYIGSTGILEVDGETTLNDKLNANNGIKVSTNTVNPYINFYKESKDKENKPKFTKHGSICSTNKNIVFTQRLHAKQGAHIDGSTTLTGQLNANDIQVNKGHKIGIKHEYGYIEWLNSKGERAAFLQNKSGTKGGGINLGEGSLYVDKNIDVTGQLNANDIKANQYELTDEMIISSDKKGFNFNGEMKFDEWKKPGKNSYIKWENDNLISTPQGIKAKTLQATDKLQIGKYNFSEDKNWLKTDSPFWVNNKAHITGQLNANNGIRVSTNTDNPYIDFYKESKDKKNKPIFTKHGRISSTNKNIVFDQRLHAKEGAHIDGQLNAAGGIKFGNNGIYNDRGTTKYSGNHRFNERVSFDKGIYISSKGIEGMKRWRRRNLADHGNNLDTKEKQWVECKDGEYMCGMRFYKDGRIDNATCCAFKN